MTENKLKERRIFVNSNPIKENLNTLKKKLDTLLKENLKGVLKKV